MNDEMIREISHRIRIEGSFFVSSAMVKAVFRALTPPDLEALVVEKLPGLVIAPEKADRKMRIHGTDEVDDCVGGMAEPDTAVRVFDAMIAARPKLGEV